MIRNYFKIAWRNLLQHKGLSFINIFGLAIGMAFAMLIGLWIRYETSFDGFHDNKDRIAVVQKNVLFNNEKSTLTATPLPLYNELSSNYPEVERATRVDWGDNHSLVAGDKKFSKPGTYVDPAFLHMFSFPLLEGNAHTALNDPNSIILTQSLARTLFGNMPAMGNTIRLDNQYDVKVTGILQDVPKNSTLQFDFLAPYEFKAIHETFIQNNRDNWGSNSLLNMVELKRGVSMSEFSKKLAPLMAVKNPEMKNQELFLHPLSDWRLRNDFKNWKNAGGRVEYVRLFGMIGLFVLLIACINFMNLSTARSEKRAREVGIRKAVGSGRGQLVLQFLAESVFTALLSFILAGFIVWLSLPLLSDIGFENIHLNLENTQLIFYGLLICLVTGLIAGSYPALYLSSFLPVKVLKGVFRQGKAPVNFRRILVVSQFSISVGLIICTSIVFQQIRFAQKRPIGYNPDNLLSIGSSKDLSDHFNALKQDLSSTGMLEAVSYASCPMTDIWNTWSDFDWEGKPAGSDMAIDAILVGMDYEKTSGLKFIQGRPFSPGYKTDSNGVILNQAALDMIGYKDPIGKTMKLGQQVLTIVGIVENIVMKDPFKPVGPEAILFNGSDAAFNNIIFARVKPTADLAKTLAVIKPIFEKYNPSLPFEYRFVDEEFGEKFRTENQVAALSGIFAALAILISCLGLFGLAAFMAERRTKEIGIRKVLGASVANLWTLLSKEFVLLVLVACFVASPLAYWLMKDWLQKYDYRIDISIWVFAIAGVLAVLIALVTVSTQAIKAAIANPVKSLRTE